MLNLIQRVAKVVNELGMAYIATLGEKQDNIREAIFACKIANILESNKDLLKFISKMHQKDLSDSLLTHKDKYIKLLEEHSINNKEIIAFKNSINSLNCDLHDVYLPGLQLEDFQRDEISELVYKVAKKAQTIFAEQSHNKDSIYSLLALAIALNLQNLNLKDRLLLANHLLLIKEIWSPSSLKKLASDFFLNPFKSLELSLSADLEQTFAKLVSYFTIKHNILENLTDENLIILYDRLKNYGWDSPSLPTLLYKLHIEAQFRYSYNRLTDSGYELLKRFQSFDAITHQIENSELKIAESYLLRNALFIDETLNVIAKHLDNIRALSIAKNSHLASMLSKINASLLKKINNNLEANKAMLSSIKSRLNKPLEHHIKKRYAELDQYALRFLQQKYFKLFENVINLIEGKNGCEQYLKELLVTKITNEYYQPNRSNSISKLRIMAQDREKIKAELLEINLVEMYEPQYLNKITSFSFRKGISEKDLKTPDDYIAGIIREIVLLCTAFQLEVLYKPLLTGTLSKTQILLKNEIISQIHKRTSITQMLYSILVGRKKEYDKLAKMSKNIKTTQLA